MAQELSQSDRRRPIVLRDNLGGRKWESTIDTISQGTCAPINPRGWVDPLNTPQAVLTKALKRNEDGVLYLDLQETYALWRDNLKQKAIEYDQRLYNDAVMIFGEAGPKMYTEKAPALLHFTGEGPQAWEPVEAALQGNSAALGKKPIASDPRIAKYFAAKEVPVLSFKDEDLMDLEDEMDPEATGGKRVPVGKKKREPVTTEA